MQSSDNDSDTDDEYVLEEEGSMDLSEAVMMMLVKMEKMRYFIQLKGMEYFV